MEIKEIYKQLTGVDIEEQKKLWDERGKGYYGEFLVFTELYKDVKGNCKILMNLEVPTNNGKTTEIDLLMIHETGIYVFEIKHYKGDIYGKDTDETWTQYFRTVKNSVFKNPILQNAYHINTLTNLFPNIPLFSVITFTSELCNLHITNLNDNIILCYLDNLYGNLNDKFNHSSLNLSMGQIDEIFNKLSRFSKMQEVILYDGKEQNFISWLEPTLLKLNEEKDNYKQAIIKTNNDNKKFKFISIISIIICFVILILSIYGINIGFKERLGVIESNYNTELDKFKQNFKHVDDINNQYIDKLNELFIVSDSTLTTLSNNIVSFTANISKTNDLFGMQLEKDAKYIVMTKDSKVYEYDIFGEHLYYNAYTNKIGKGASSIGKLKSVQFFNIKKEDITYIKIKGIELYSIDVVWKSIAKDLELEVYTQK